MASDSAGGGRGVERKEMCFSRSGRRGLTSSERSGEISNGVVLACTLVLLGHNGREERSGLELYGWDISQALASLRTGVREIERDREMTGDMLHKSTCTNSNVKTDEATEDRAR